jgi:hypothetical protein
MKVNFEDSFIKIFITYSRKYTSGPAVLTRTVFLEPEGETL